MKKSHSGLWLALAAILLAAVYSAVVFLAKPAMDPGAWILYGFTMAAFLLVALQLLTASRAGSGLVLDTVLGKATLVYFVIQLIVDGIICMCFRDLPVTPVIIFEVVLLLAYLVFAFVMLAAQSHSAAQDFNDRKAVQRIRQMEGEVRGLEDRAATPELKKALHRLAEDIHFSDVASLPGLSEVEGRINEAIEGLRGDLDDDEADPMARIEDIRRLLKERDRTAAILRR